MVKVVWLRAVAEVVDDGLGQVQARGLGGERRNTAVGEHRRPGAPVPAAVAEIPRPGSGHRVAVDRRAEGAGVATAGRRRAPRGARDAQEDEAVAIVGGEGVDLRRRRRRDVADVTDAEVGLDRAVGGGPARGQVGAAGARAGQVLEVRDRETVKRRELHRRQRGAVGVGRITVRRRSATSRVTLVAGCESSA
ncbi:MAG: hypothetical protein IPH07_24810 [Deltaproteobacteria bacterium]|nr:hypothetical protein [Deltaproteobacteria bacterium]